MAKKWIVEYTLGAILMVMLIFAQPIPMANAQQESQGFEDLFVYPDARVLAELNDKQEMRLDALRSDPTTVDIHLINLKISALGNLDKIRLNFSVDQPVLLDVVRIEKRSSSDYSWFGFNSQGQDEAILVVQDDEIYGTIRTGNKLHRVRPLDGDLHVLISVDETKFPKEHPPEFQEIERSTELQRNFREQLRAPRDVQDTCTEYTAIIAYTANAKSQVRNIDAFIQLVIDETNQGYTKSGINTRINLAHKYQTNYTETSNMEADQNRFRIKNDGHMDEVHDLRNQYVSDVAILITKSNKRYCGIASAIGATADMAFAVVGQNCAAGYYSFAHEIGHLQGARHNEQVDSNNSPFPYGHGYYYQPDRWRTVMSYNCPDKCIRLNNWSNPNISRNGVAMGTTATNHNARVLNETACTVANFRKSIIR